MNEKPSPFIACPDRRQCLTGLGSLAIMGSLGACSGALLPGQGPPIALFRLTPKSSFPGNLPDVKWQLVLETPTSNAALNTTRIALQRDPMRIEYYANAGWVDRGPLMLQTLMLESFENSGAIVSVGRENVGLRSDFILKTDLREFQAEYDGGGPPEVKVGVTLKLVRMPQRAIIGSEHFAAKYQAEEDSLEGVVRAFDGALGKVLKIIVAWTLAKGQNAHGTS